MSYKSKAKYLIISIVALLLSFSVKAAAVEAEMSQVTLFVEGMMKSRGGVTWMSWPDSVVVALSELPGISGDNIVVNLERDAFTLQYDAERVSLEEMYQTIRELGYSPGVEPTTGETISQTDSQTENSPLLPAFASSRAEDKLVVAAFSAEWCAACILLKERVLSDNRIEELLANYIVVEIDMDTYMEVARSLEVVGMPTLLVLNANGEELFRSVGLIEADALAEELAALSGR